MLGARRTLSRRRSNVTVVDGAAEDLAIDDDSVDALWAVNTMHHWTDVRRGVDEIARVLRPGGRVVLVDEDFTDASHPEHDRFGDADDDEHHHGFAMVDADHMGERLVAAGLVDVEAALRRIADRPSIVVTARAPTEQRPGTAPSDRSNPSSVYCGYGDHDQSVRSDP